MKVRSPFIQSVYSSSVFTFARGSACAEKVALGVQYSRHPCQPFPVSQASKNCFAMLVMSDIRCPPFLVVFSDSRSAGDEETCLHPTISGFVLATNGGLR